MINRIGISNIAFRGYISDNIIAARGRVEAKKAEIAARQEKPLPAPRKRSLLMRLISKPAVTQESETKRLDSELLTELKKLRYYQNMRRQLKGLGVSEEFLDKFATAIHSTYCSGYKNVYYKCDYKIPSISPSSQISETDDVMKEAITVLSRLKRAGYTIQAEKVFKAVESVAK